MLRIVLDATEVFNQETNEFSKVGGVVLDLEHSLVSLSKWESKHQKPFLSAGGKTSEEIFDYLKFMIVTEGVDPDVMYRCSQEDVDLIQKYIDSSQSATTFGLMPPRRGPAEVITSELIYFWMIHYNINFECQYWHLNRLFSLIKICNIKTGSGKQKLSKHEMAQRRAELNAKRKAELGTSG
jgi:hypothetical protein